MMHTDQGRNFESELFREVCYIYEITKTRTTPYHPASNGQVERFNRTLLQMIRCYVRRGQQDRDVHLPLLTAAYRSTSHGSTGFTPNKMMLGREVYMPVDLTHGGGYLTQEGQDPETVKTWSINLRGFIT